MKPTDKPAFQRLITDALAFYRQDLTPFSIGVWWQACEPFDMEQVTKALTAHAVDPDRGHFPPKPADLIRVLRGTRGDRALLAWSKAYGAIGSVGGYTSVVFDDPAIHATIADMGGWPAFCRAPVDELPFLQRRFCDTYRAYSVRPGHEYIPVLQGDSDASNALRGHERTRVAMVGNKAMCEAVMLNGGRPRLDAA